jgi:uncharacterized iron-regulated membrane protein
VTVAPDWAPAGSDALKQRQALDEATRQALDASAKADAGEMSGMAMPGMSMPMMPDARSLARLDYAPLDQVIRSVQPLGLAAPVLVAPPSSIGAPWKASSDAQDRPRQASVTVDGKSGRILSRENFGERPLVDRVINYAIAAHEGQLFGPINQLINLVVASGLMIVSVSGVLLWWRRRPAGVLGAPPHRARPRLASLFVVLVGILGILLPLFAVSLLAVIIVEQLVLRRFESSARWLGLPDRKEKRVIAVLSSVAGSGR